jgi:hypothetical protein
MAIRFSSKALSTAAVGIAVAVFGLGVAGATSVAKTSTVPLAGIKLVSETSVPPSALAAAARNGNRRHIEPRRAWTYDYWDASRKAGELVAVDIR